MLRTASGSIPMPRSPPRASPLSLSRIRWYLARFVMGAAVLHAGPGRVKRLVSLWKAPAANLLLRTGRDRRALPPHPGPLPQGEGDPWLCRGPFRQPSAAPTRSAPREAAPPFSLSPRQRAGVRGNELPVRSACPRLDLLPTRTHSAEAILVRPFDSMTEPAITPQLVQQHNLTPEEFARIQAILGREPSYTELGIFSVMWSEHCSYKNTRPLLKTFPTKSPRILVGAGEENAGIIDIGDDLAIAFKIESHNHPSAVEPFQGAATGVGGIIRDIFTMGARPICSLNSLRFGPITGEERGTVQSPKSK